MFESFKGTTLWTNLMLIFGYVFMAYIIIMLISDAIFLFVPSLIIFVVVLILMWSAQREVKIRILRKFAGMKVITGTLDEEEDMGEAIEFRIKKIVPFHDLTQAEKDKIKELVENERDLVKQLDGKTPKTYYTEEEKEEKEEKKTNKKEVKKIEDKS